MLPKTVALGPAPEAVLELVPELVHEAVLSVALSAALSVVHGVAPELVHALSAVLAPYPVPGFGREVDREVAKEAVPVSLVLPEVQKA